MITSQAIRPGHDAAPRLLPVLMYHEISDRQQTGSNLAVDPCAFAEQLDYLHGAGYRTVTAGALPEVLAADLPLDRTVVLTFDDGYEDFHARALPLLDGHGFTATVFVTSGWVQDDDEWQGARRPGRMLSWSQVAEAAAAGIEIGAHSRGHPQLDQLPAGRLHEELYASKARLEDRLGIQIPGVAYPFGYSNARVRQEARASGYGYGYAVRNMTASPDADPFALPRLTVHRSTTLAEFRAMIDGQLTLTMVKDRALTRGWAVVRRTRALLNRGVSLCTAQASPWSSASTPRTGGIRSAPRSTRFARRRCLPWRRSSSSTTTPRSTSAWSPRRPP
jgi:peptidoglycan/xylan/chitin deacetylase (PgdA/CDA1 family)